MDHATNDFQVFDHKLEANYLPYEGNVIETQAISRPLTKSAVRNVERYLQLKATDKIFLVDYKTDHKLEPLTPAVLTDGEVTESRDTIQVANVQHDVLFVQAVANRGWLEVVGRVQP